MGNTGGNFKNNVDSVDIELDFEIDPNKGQQEIRKFGYYFNKKGQCRSIKTDERVGRFPSQQEYEEFGSALERYIFFLLRDQYNMTEKILKSTDDQQPDDNNDNDNDNGNTIDAEQPSQPQNDRNDGNNDNDVEMEDNTESKKQDKTDKESECKQAPQKKKGMITKTNNNKKKQIKEKPKRKTRSKMNEDKIAKSRIYLSPNYGEKETLLLLIPGSGAVRAGQWARSICINDNLAAGCMYTYIAEAYKRHWGVVLFDPNGRSEHGRIYSDEHVSYVYDRYIEGPFLSKKDCKIRNVLIVCHSAGGMATTRLLNNKMEHLLPRIRGVAGTDTFFGRAQNKQIQNVYKRYIVNWVTSSQPLGTMLSNTVPKRVSAGHTAHEYTSAAAFAHIFNYFDAMMRMHKMGNITDKSLGKKKKKQKKSEKKGDDDEEQKKEKKEDDGEVKKNEEIQCDVMENDKVKDIEKEKEDNKGKSEEIMKGKEDGSKEEEIAINNDNDDGTKDDQEEAPKNDTMEVDNE